MGNRGVIPEDSRTKVKHGTKIRKDLFKINFKEVFL